MAFKQYQHAQKSFLDALNLSPNNIEIKKKIAISRLKISSLKSICVDYSYDLFKQYIIKL
jgi:hypothetical protein